MKSLMFLVFFLAVLFSGCASGPESYGRPHRKATVVVVESPQPKRVVVVRRHRHHHHHHRQPSVRARRVCNYDERIHDWRCNHTRDAVRRRPLAIR